MNMELLEQRIEKSGLKKSYVAEQIGIDRASLRNKMIGKTEFTMSEIGKLCKVLNLNDKDKVKIFFV